MEVVLDEESRAKILEAYPPKFSEIICHHVTLEYGVPFPIHTDPIRDIKIVNHCIGDDIECFVVEIKGRSERKDGGVLHLTYSHQEGVKAVKSNQILQEVMKPRIPPIWISGQVKWTKIRRK